MMTKAPHIITGPIRLYIDDREIDLTIKPRRIGKINFMQEYAARKKLMVDTFKRRYFDFYGAAYHRTTNTGDYPR